MNYKSFSLIITLVCFLNLMDLSHAYAGKGEILKNQKSTPSTPSAEVITHLDQTNAPKEAITHSIDTRSQIQSIEKMHTAQRIHQLGESLNKDEYYLQNLKNSTFSKEEANRITTKQTLENAQERITSLQVSHSRAKEWLKTTHVTSTLNSSSPIALSSLSSSTPVPTLADEKAKQIQASTREPKKLWNELESLWKLKHSQILKNIDQEKIDTLFQEYFDPSSFLIHPASIGFENPEWYEDLAANLQISPDSTLGKVVRKELNKGILAYCFTSDKETKEKIYDGIKRTLQADHLFASGNRKEGLQSLPNPTAQQVLDGKQTYTSQTQASILEKVNKAQGQIDHQLSDYPTIELRTEISSWNQYSQEKEQTLDLVKEYALTADQLRANSGTINKEVFSYSKTAIEVGLGSLTEATQIAGGHAAGDFEEAVSTSEFTLEVAKGLLDISLSMTPGISIGKDVYEALSGKSLIDGSKLDFTSRSFAVLGVVTAGGSNIAKGSIKGLIKLGELAHARGILGHGFNSAIQVAQSGITNIVRYGPINPGSLHLQELPNPTGAMKYVSDTFRSGTYISYKTTEPTILYRLSSSTVKEGEEHFSNFWTRVKPSSPTQGMIDLALERSWGSKANLLAQIEVPAGETLHEGITASIQKIGAHMSEFLGGGNQIYINKDIPKEWVKKVEKLVK